MTLNLAQPRSVGDILSATFSLYANYFVAFATIALAVVIPLDLLTVGVIGGQLTDYDGAFLRDGGVAYTILYNLLATPLITAGHVSAVMDVGEGKTPSAARSLRRAGAVLLPVIGAILLAFVGTAIGFVLLVLPGIYLWIRWCVAVQAVVVEREDPLEALGRSGELVEGSWWTTFGRVLLVSMIGGLLAYGLGVPIGVAAHLTDSGPLYLLGTILVDAITLSFVALGATLIYFDLWARKEPLAMSRALPGGPDRPEAVLPAG